MFKVTGGASLPVLQGVGKIVYVLESLGTRIYIVNSFEMRYELFAFLQSDQCIRFFKDSVQRRARKVNVKVQEAGSDY